MFPLALVLELLFAPLVGAASLPDLESALSAISAMEAPWSSTSKRFKKGLVGFCGKVGCTNLTVVEVGILHGHTTAVLSHLFRSVIAVDYENKAIEKARETVETYGRPNVIFFQMDVYKDGWGAFRGNAIHVILIDANHDVNFVMSDTRHALAFPELSWLVMHDYGHKIDRGVGDVVDLFCSTGHIRCHGIGLKQYEKEGGLHPAPEHGPEGVICRVLKRWWPNRVADAFLGQTTEFLLFPYDKFPNNAVAVEKCKVVVLALDQAVLDVTCTSVRQKSDAFQQHFHGLARLHGDAHGMREIVWEWTGHAEGEWGLTFDRDLVGAVVSTAADGRHGGKVCVLVRAWAIQAIVERRILSFNRFLTL